MIIAGASAYARTIDFKKFREIADACGAVLMVDMAHIAGLVAAGLHPSPIPYADVVTTTTHKTLRGPRGGMILCNQEAADKYNFNNHLMLVDLTNFDQTGKAVEKLLDSVNITCNKNTIPIDPKSPFVTSGVRLGTPAVTSRGFNTGDMDQIAEAIAMMIKEGEPAADRARAIVAELTAKYPLK